jgi:hypothetical protein
MSAFARLASYPTKVRPGTFVWPTERRALYRFSGIIQILV